MSRTPDYRVKCLNKTTGAKGIIGGAWVNDDKSITIILDNYIFLQQTGDLVITLFPLQSKQTTPK